jgi:hypothetical protein
LLDKNAKTHHKTVLEFLNKAPPLPDSLENYMSSSSLILNQFYKFLNSPKSVFTHNESDFQAKTSEPKILNVPKKLEELEYEHSKYSNDDLADKINRLEDMFHANTEHMINRNNKNAINTLHTQNVKLELEQMDLKRMMIELQAQVALISDQKNKNVNGTLLLKHLLDVKFELADLIKEIPTRAIPVNNSTPKYNNSYMETIPENNGGNNNNYPHTNQQQNNNSQTNYTNIIAVHPCLLITITLLLIPLLIITTIMGAKGVMLIPHLTRYIVTILTTS